MSELKKHLYDSNSEGDKNRVLLRGWIEAPVKFDHQNTGSPIYTTMIRVERKSGVSDIIPVFIKENKLVSLDRKPLIGDFVEVHGYFHSKNTYLSDNKRILENYVYADKISYASTILPPISEVYLTGEICRCNEARVTTGGRRLADFLLRVRRKTHRFSTIPCVVWGEYRSTKIAEAGEGTKLELMGRIQSREYTKIENGVGISRTIYEVSVTDFEIKSE